MQRTHRPDARAGGRWAVGSDFERRHLPLPTSHLPSRAHRAMRWSAGLLALALPPACHFAPPHAQPPLPTPPLYDASLSVTGMAGARAADIGWRDFFRDPRLDALI